jgi:hypothetical protein
MFGTNFKSSIFVLPWLLLPLVVLAFFVVFVDPWIQENGISNCPTSGQDGGQPGSDGEGELVYNEESVSDDFGLDIDLDEFPLLDEIVSRRGVGWEFSRECFLSSTIIAVIVNFLFLLVIPCALGGFDGGKKRFEFYLGFFIILACLITLPLVYYLFYELDNTTFVIFLGLHLFGFMATYITGSRFVSPAYRKAFWFA